MEHRGRRHRSQPLRARRPRGRLPRRDAGAGAVPCRDHHTARPPASAAGRIQRGSEPDPGGRGPGERARAAAPLVGTEPLRRQWKERNAMKTYQQLLVLGLLALAACKRVEGAQVPSRTQAQPQRPPAPVSVATAVERDVPVYLDQIGKNVAPEVVTIKPQVSGRITAIHVKDGATVKRGDLLFTIDPRPYRAQLESAEANVSRNQAELELARLEFKRVQALLQTDAISQQDHDSRRSAVAVSEAQLRLSQAAVDTAKLNLEYCYIRSPIDGRAGKRLVDLGNVVGPSAPGGLMVIQRLDPMYADFSIPENDLTSVQRAIAAKTSAKGLFVYVVKDDSTAELRPVTVGQRQGDLVAVAQGLKGGERVITAGQLAVTPGGQVRSQP